MSGTEPWEGWRTAKPVEWLRALQPVTLTPAERSVALVLALAATSGQRDPSQAGKDARPGLSRLEWESGASRSSVIRALARLESLGLIYCAERGTGRGRASVYWLTVRDGLERHGQTYQAWLAEHRPADAEPVKGVMVTPFEPPAEPVKGVMVTPFEPVKSVIESPKGCHRDPLKGVTSEPHQVSTHQVRDTPVPDHRSGRTAPRFASDLDDLDALEAELDDLLGLYDTERSIVTGMLTAGNHPTAVWHKIIADRGWTPGDAGAYAQALDERRRIIRGET